MCCLGSERERIRPCARLLRRSVAERVQPRQTATLCEQDTSSQQHLNRGQFETSHLDPSQNRQSLTPLQRVPELRRTLPGKDRLPPAYRGRRGATIMTSLMLPFF